MSNTVLTDQAVPREPCVQISCILPDDGTDKKLMRVLRDEKGITRVNSTNCMGLAILSDAKAKFGELPQPVLVRRVDAIVQERHADDLYDYIYEKGCIGRPRGGIIWLNSLTLVSPFALPADTPLEKD